MKELFRLLSHFLQNFFQNGQWEHAKTQKRGQYLHPKVPERAKERARQAEVQHRAEEGAEQDVDAKLPLRDPDGIPHRAHGHGQAKQQVAQHKEPRPTAADGAQQVVGKSQNAAEQRRAAKQQIGRAHV